MTWKKPMKRLSKYEGSDCGVVGGFVLLEEFVHKQQKNAADKQVEAHDGHVLQQVFDVVVEHEADRRRRAGSPR